MNIALVTYNLQIGGIERVIFNQAKLFQESGHQVSVIETQGQGPWKSYFQKNGIEVVTFSISFFQSKATYCKTLIKFLEDFDVLFIHDSPYVQAGISLLPDRLIVFPVLHSILDSMLDNASSNLLSINKIVTVSPYLTQLLVEQRHVEQDKIVMIPTAVIKEQDIPVRPKQEVGKKLIFIGRIEHTEKAVLIFPDIIRKVLEHTSISQFHIYGEGSDKKALEEKIIAYDLQETIIMKGYLPYEKLMETFAQYDFLILPSFFEGQGLVIQEAMAAGVIPFASRLEGRTTVWIEEGRHGFLANPGDSEDFASAIIQNINREDLLQISENAKEVVRNEFTFEKMKDRYTHLVADELKFPGQISRDGVMDLALLGDLPRAPFVLVKPIRRLMKLLGIWK